MASSRKERRTEFLITAAILCFLIILLTRGVAAKKATSTTGPLSGQIIVDPDHAEWLTYKDGAPFFMCGPGDPEGFLYRGTRNADGTRTGDQMDLINKLIPTGANSIYLMAIRSHGGDGDATQNPFINSDPTMGLDNDILDQWEDWFTLMDENGIVIFFFFYDDSACVWGCDKLTDFTVPAEEQAFIQGLVNRFEHHKNLIWVVAEEYTESFRFTRASNIAAEIRAADDHDHVIAVHQTSGLTFDFADDPNVEQFAIQYTPTTVTPDTLHDGMVTAWNNAAGRYNLNMSEVAFGGIGTGETARKNVWGIVMGGAYAMLNGMDIQNTAVSDLEDCGRVVSFMTSTTFNEMAPHDELAFDGTDYVLALPGQSYIAYASNLVGNIGVTNMTAGTYCFKWFDIPTGTVVEQRNVTVAAGDQSWTKPANIGNELAVFIRRDSGPPVSLEGDANQDAIVDGLDLLLMGRSWGATNCENWFLNNTDLNDDGMTDGVDLTILAGNFGQSF